MDEAELSRAFPIGDGACLEAVIGRYGQALLRYCHHILCDYHEAQDAVQDALLRAWSRRNRFRAGTNLEAWLYKLAYHACIDLLRQRRRQLLAPPPPSGHNPDYIGPELRAALSVLTPEERGALAHRFYNDTYQMDQNACSSPQLVLWLEDGGDPACRARWWEAVAAEAAERYPFGPFQAARKLERLCLCAMTMEQPSVAAVERYQGNLLYVARLAGLSGNLPSLAGGFGLFFEAALPSLEALAPLLPPKAQTLVCGGLEPAEVAALLARAGARGVDRVVPLGQALEMDTVWDGRDLIAALSRIIG